MTVFAAIWHPCNDSCPEPKLFISECFGKRRRKIPKKAPAAYDNYMSFRFTVLASVISLTVLGCATNRSVSTSETKLWRTQKERQQRVAREAGRIGYIGNAGPALGSSFGSTIP